MISKGKTTIEELNISQIEVAAKYFNINKIPCLMSSPLREDVRPSFSLYCPKDDLINYKDFGNGDSGNIITLLSKIWGIDYGSTIKKINKECNNINCNIIKSSHKIIHRISTSNVQIKCKIREWREYDINYWNQYGISIKWLKYAEVYPISHKIILKDNKQYNFIADKYAYAYVEHKEKTTLKIYQPYNTKGFKWSNNHDKSVISLWTKVPKKGDKICICSSLKDALCLWINTGIPSIAVQGEGYLISNTAINELKKRYNKIYIFFDNDKPGLKDGENLSKITGFINVVLPQFKEGKDISDYYKSLSDKTLFKQNILKLFL